MSNFMGVTVSGGNKSSGPVLSAGSYDGVIHAIIQYGVQKRKFKGEEQEPKNMVKVLIEVPQEDGSSAIIGYREVTASINDRANFYKLFKSIGLVSNTGELAELFSSEDSVQSILGTPVHIKVDEVDIEGKTVSMVSEVSKLDPRLPQPTPVQDGFIFSFTKPDIEVFKTKLSKFARRRIMHALNADTLPKECAEFYLAEQEAESGQGVSADAALR